MYYRNNYIVYINTNIFNIYLLHLIYIFTFTTVALLFNCELFEGRSVIPLSLYSWNVVQCWSNNPISERKCD